MTSDSPTNLDTLQISYLYDAEGRPYGAYYEDCEVSSGTAGRVDGAWFATLTDLRGDVLELLDADSARFASYRYDVWGRPELDDGDVSRDAPIDGQVPVVHADPPRGCGAPLALGSASSSG